MAKVISTEKAPAVFYDKITLEFSQNEAETLLAILLHIGGDPRTSARKHADSMREALQDISGLTPKLVEKTKNPNDYNSIYFADGSI